MAFLNKINSKANAQTDTGFGSNSSSYGGRFISKNGNANVQKSGVGFFEGISWYHTMLNLPRWKFLFIVILFYFMVNFVFASMYYFVGVEHLAGITAKTNLDKFGQAFFFSVQTFTTVGYGHISPTGFITSFIASVEALFGLLSFAIATGLFYGRFSKPKAHIAFSENALIAPYLGRKALMFRLAPYKNTNLTDAEARVTVGLPIEENGKIINKFYSLDLEISKINLLNLSWTVVHPIDEKSPLFGMSENDFNTNSGEFIVVLKAFDDMFSNTVVKRTSYLFSEIVFDAKFDQMFSKNENNSKTVLEIDKLNNYKKI